MDNYLHSTQRVETVQGSVIVKQINPEFIATKQQQAVYRRREHLTKLLAEQALPIVYAIDITDAGDFIYPFIEGYHIYGDDITPQHAQHIGAFLAKMHAIKLPQVKFDDLLPPIMLNTQLDHWQNLLACAARTIPQLQVLMTPLSSYILQTIAKIPKTTQRFVMTQVLSHRDLTPRNVLWQNSDTFKVIDCEWLGPIHPEVELLTAAMDWSCDGKRWAPLLFQAVIQGYCNRSAYFLKEQFEELLILILEHWFSWLGFNLQKLIVGKDSAEDDKKDKSLKEALYTLQAVEFVRNNYQILEKTWTSSPSYEGL